MNSNFNRKAQLNQVFTIILVVVVVGATIFIGMKSMGGIFKQKCDVEFISFKDDVRTSITSNNDYGSVDDASIITPCDYTTLCFVDGETILNGLPFSFDDNMIIDSSVNEGVQTNIFLINKDKTISVDFVDEITLDNKEEPLCINSKNGKFKYLIQGRGRTALVKPAEEQNPDEDANIE